MINQLVSFSDFDFYNILKASYDEHKHLYFVVNKKLYCLVG